MAEALERDPHTIGEWLANFRQAGPAGLALEYIASHEGVWLTTSDEIADWYLAQGYDQALARAGGAAVA